MLEHSVQITNMRSLATLLAAAVLSCFVAAPALGQTNSNGKALAASNVLKLRADTPRSSVEPLVKQFVVPFAGTVRVRWQFKTDDTGATVYLDVHSEVDSCAASTT